MNKKIIFIGLALIIFVTACGEKSMEKKLQEQNIPQFTIDLLKIGKNCNCEMNDDKKITCLCQKTDWDKSIKIICNPPPPSNEYDMVTRCFAVLQNK